MSKAEQLSLRPFFSYYGGKWRDTPRLYPPPQYDTIVEPFAGSAGYSLRFPKRRVILCELDPIVASVWRYLIGTTPEAILKLPDLDAQECVDDLRVCQEEKWLIGFWLNRGAASPRKRPSRWMRDRVRPGSFWGDRVRTTIASQLSAIQHWKIYECGYEHCPAKGKATWFIDPPYEDTGHHYRCKSTEVDYKHLSNWCVSRPGQVIVCERAGASWLPFKDIGDTKTTRTGRRSKEVVWHRPANDTGAQTGL